MARYYFGQVLLAYVKDGQGHTKEHPIIVIDTDEACASGDPLQVVVVSTKILKNSPRYHVPVHDGHKLNPRTGLSMGSLPDDPLGTIIDKVNELLDDETFTGWVDGD